MLRVPTTTCAGLQRVLQDGYESVFRDLDVQQDPLHSARHAVLVDTLNELTRKCQRTLNIVVSACARRANAHAPVNRLVDDVLARILAALSWYDRQRAARTCWRWRAVARSDGSIWSSLSYDFAIETLALPAILALSKSSLLDLSFNIGGDTKYMIEEDMFRLQNVLMFRCHRLRTLSVTGDVDVDHVLQLLHAPKLQSLTLDWTPTKKPLSIYIPVLQPAFPSVTALTLHNVCLDPRLCDDDDDTGFKMLRSFPSLRMLSIDIPHPDWTGVNSSLRTIGLMMEDCPHLEELRLVSLHPALYLRDVEMPLDAIEHPLRRVVLRASGNAQGTVTRILWFFDTFRPSDIEIINAAGIVQSFRPRPHDAEIGMFLRLQDSAVLSMQGSLVANTADIFDCAIVGRDRTGLTRTLRSELSLESVRMMMTSAIVVLVIEFSMWRRWPSGVFPHLETLRLRSNNTGFLGWSRFVPLADFPALHTVELHCAAQRYGAVPLCQKDIERFVQAHIPAARLPLAVMTITGMEVSPANTSIDHTAFAQHLTVDRTYRSPYPEDVAD